MSKLLTKKGKLVTLGGKLVTLDGILDDIFLCTCCSPPPPPPPECDCYPPPTLDSLRLEIPAADPTRLDVRWEGQWSPPDGCFADNDDARAKATFLVQYLDANDNDLGGDGGPANLGFNEGGQGGPLDVACQPAAPKIAKAKARILTKDGKCDSPWSDTIPLNANSPTYEELCPPPVKYICAIRSPCAELPLRAGRWGWIADGRWIPVDNGCARFPPFNCTMAPPPNRPGTVGEVVDVGCTEVTPNTTQECITEEEFNKGGWIKVSGPHDTLQICEASCKPRCLPGQVEKWFPPDCGPGPCVPVCVDGDINPCEGFPYDCDSEGSCNGWLDAHPNAPCPERQADNPLP